MTAHRFVKSIRDLGAELDAYDQGQHAALVADREIARAAARREARAQATTAEGRDLIDSVLTALERAHRDGAYRLVLLQGERVVRCRYKGNPKFDIVAGAVRGAAEAALRGAGLEVVRAPGSSWDLDVCRSRADRDSAPPSTTRPLLAGDRKYQELRWAALGAFDRLVEGLGAGVIQIGAPRLSAETRRELADLANDLSIATHEPRKGAVPRVAELCAQMARDVAVEQPTIAGSAWAAAEACMSLATYANEWAIRQAGGGP